jgi:hypothetical protein
MPEAPAGDHPLCPECPICRGKMELVYDRLNQQVCVCTDCHSGLTIPATAWEILRRKRSGIRKPE